MLLAKLLFIALCGYLWRLGGKKGFSKGYRRFGCPITMMISIILSQNWLGLGSIPLLIAATTLGYGESSKLMKLLKNKYLVRLVCGLAYSLASVFILWGNWWLYGFHILFVSLGVMLAGNQKFKWEDEREEGFIGTIVGLCPILG